MSDGKPPVIVNGQIQMPKLSLRQRTSAALLGVKGSLLRSQSKEKVGKEENPVARLKLLLVRPLLPLLQSTEMTSYIDCLIPLAPLVEPVCHIHPWCGRVSPSAGTKPSLC